MMGFSGGANDKEYAFIAGDLGWEDPLEKGMTASFSILAWRISWTEDPGGLQFMGSQRVRHDWATNTFSFSSHIIKLNHHSIVKGLQYPPSHILTKYGFKLWWLMVQLHSLFWTLNQILWHSVSKRKSQILKKNFFSLTFSFTLNLDLRI